MKIVTVTFDYPGNGQYRRLFNVFRASCAAVMPEVKFEAIEIAPPADIKAGYSTGMNSNVHKLRVWQRVMETATETVAFCDCDMIALGSIADVDRLDFDLAYTVRKHPTIPINGGVVFVRPTEAGRAAMRRWNEIDDLMFCDHKLHQAYRRKYAGMNQAAFGYLLERHADIAKMVPVPCALYNSCCETWPQIGPDTRMVHLKGPLRRGLLAGSGPSAFQSYLRPVVLAWRKYAGLDVEPVEIPRAPGGKRLPHTTLDQAAAIAMRRPVHTATNMGQLRRRFKRI